MKKAFVILSLLLALFGFSVSVSNAEVMEAPTITVHTTVLNPQTNGYVDSLGLSDSMYNPGDSVTFHVTIANSGSNALPNATVENTLPDYVTFTAGAGNLSPSKKILTFTIKNLAPKTTQTFAISGKIADTSNLPTNQGVVCVADKSVITSQNDKPTSSASFCITKGTAPQPQTKGGLTEQNTPAPIQSRPTQSKVFPANNDLKSTPPTGPEMLSFLSIFGSASLGFALKKLSKAQKDLRVKK